MAHMGLTIIIHNNTNAPLQWSHGNAAPDANNWAGGTWWKLKHGEMDPGNVPTTANIIQPGCQGTWGAKSTGKNIQGAINYYLDNNKTLAFNMFFLVNSSGDGNQFNGHKYSVGSSSPSSRLAGVNANYSGGVDTGSMHPTVNYTIDGTVAPEHT